MQIRANFKADITEIKATPNKDTRGIVAGVKIATTVTSEESKGILGELFHRVAFGAMSIDETEDGGRQYSFGYKDLNPNIVCEFHQVKLLGRTIAAAPALQKVVASTKGKPEVKVVILIPVSIESEAFAGLLMMHSGKMVDVEMNPAQQELPNTNVGPKVVRTSTGPYGNAQSSLV